MSKKDFLATYNGSIFYPLDYENTDDVNLEAIAVSISHSCRFAGHTKYFYSIAQHSIMVSDIIEKELFNTTYYKDFNINMASMIGLLHDASESYLSDICRPIKKYINEYSQYEINVEYKICKSFGIDNLTFDKYQDIVKIADNIALFAEAIALMNPSELWIESQKECFDNSLSIKYSKLIHCENMDYVKGKFIHRFIRLSNRLGLNSDLINSLDIVYKDNMIPIMFHGITKYYINNGILYDKNMNIISSINPFRFNEVMDSENYLKNQFGGN